LSRVGGDLGYTNDPTEIAVFQEIELPERRIVKLVLRVRMEHVAYPDIAQTIALLDRYCTPAGIGVDNGGDGMAVVQELLNSSPPTPTRCTTDESSIQRATTMSSTPYAAPCWPGSSPSSTKWARRRFLWSR